MSNKLETDCLNLEEGKVNDHIDLLMRQVVDTGIALNRVIIIAALVISAAIIIAAFICRPSGNSRYRSIGNYRVLDTQTGNVREVE